MRLIRRIRSCQHCLSRWAKVDLLITPGVQYIAYSTQYQYSSLDIMEASSSMAAFQWIGVQATSQLHGNKSVWLGKNLILGL